MNEEPLAISDKLLVKDKESPAVTVQAGAIGRLIEALGDRLNPILVKETRQALKSKQFTLWFVLLLIACWITTLGAIAYIGPSVYYVSAGPYLLFAYFVILALPLLVVVPFSAYRSLSSEQEENTRDLLEVSTLTPRQVIHGKLGSALLQITIYLSALAPCLVFTYLLRGVELVQILLLIVYAVLSSIGLSLLGLVIAAATKQKYAQVVMSVALAGGLFTAFGGLLNGAGVLLQLDGAELRSEWFWWMNVGMLSLYATTLAIAYAASIALTTFTSANRSTGLRWAVFAQQAVFVAWVAGLVVFGMPAALLYASFAVAAVYWFLAGAIMTGETPTLSLRVRRSLPQSFLGRLFGTWFNPGGGSGYAFAMCNLLACMCLTIATMQIDPSTAMGPVLYSTNVALLTAYVVLYLGLGRLAVLGLRRVAEVTLLGCFLIQILFALGGSSLPYVITTLSERFRIAPLSPLSLPSPWWNLSQIESGRVSPDQAFVLLLIVAAGAVVVFLINLVLAGHEARQLRIAAPRRVLEDDLDLNPPPEPAALNPWGDVAQPAAEPPA